jgi:negative regulator of flagellin synthesis FlgM
MKIGNSSEVAAASVAIEKSGSAKHKASAQTQPAKPAEGTQLELSSTATQLLSATGAQSSETFDSAKVQRIAQAISEGKFSVNAEAVADKLLSNAQEVLGSRDSNH